MVENDLAGWNFAGQNLTNTYFSFAKLTGSNLSGADARGASFQDATLDGANTTNLIQSNGHIAGLDLTAGETLVVRDYDGNSGTATAPLPIIIEEHLTMDATGTLRLVFDADPWDSLISVAPGIAVALGGTLELNFAPDLGVATQSGRTIDLFDWTGVTPTGTFTVSSPYAWDLSQLYTSGEVTLTSVPEPGATMLLGIGTWTMLRRRSRRGTTRPSIHALGVYLVSSAPQRRISEWRQS